MSNKNTEKGVLRTFYDEFKPDASVGEQLIGNALSPGLFVRAFCHMLTALLGGYDPQFGQYDVTAKSPVVDLRGRFSADLSARLLSLAAAVVSWQAFQPLGLATTLGPVGESVVQLYIVANIAVLAVDPLLFLLARR